MTVEFVRARSAERSPSGLIAFLGMEADVVEPGRVVFMFEASERLANPFGTVHGGILATVLDSAMGMAALTSMPDEASAPTVALEVKYVRAVATDAGLLRAEGVVVHAGSRVVTTEGRIVGDDQRLYATATAICLVDRAHLRSEPPSLDS